MKFKRSACIEPLYSEIPFLDRFQAAKDDGFECVEFWGWTDKDLDAIEAGTLVGSVAQYPNVQAETAVQVAIDAIGGKTFEEHTETAAKLITKDNIEEYRSEMADYLD